MSEQDAIRAKNEFPRAKEAFDRVGADLLKQIGETKPEETDRRESLYFQFIALRTVLQALGAEASNVDLKQHRETLAEAGFRA